MLKNKLYFLHIHLWKTFIFILSNWYCSLFYSCSWVAASIVTKENIALLTTEILNNTHVFNFGDFWKVSTQKVSACYVHIWLGSIFLSCWVIDGFLVLFIRYTYIQGWDRKSDVGLRYILYADKAPIERFYILKCR